MRALVPFVGVVASAAALCSCDVEKKDGKVDLVVEAERVAASKSRTPEDVRPYDESLSWHEYKVKRVLSGELNSPVIRVAHWTVLGGKAVPLGTRTGDLARMKLSDFETIEGIKGVNKCDELDVVADEPPRFLDLSQPPPSKIVLEDDRMDYGGNFSDQMKLYWKLRPQLSLMVMGNSQATKDIATPMLCGGENVNTPVALNLAPPGGNLEMQCLLVQDYILPLPRVEWLIWVASPRLFNEKMTDSRKFRQFSSSRGRAFDLERQGELWPVPSAPRVSAAQLANLDIGVDSWGWEGRKKTVLPEVPEKARRQLLKDILPPDFVFSKSRWELFTSALRAIQGKGVRVLLVNAPMHPFFKDLPSADPDGTTHEGMAEMVRRFAALDAEMPRVWFRDFNLAAGHDFKHGDFYDGDHLNRSGARELTRRLVVWMEECEKEDAATKSGPPPAR